MLRSVCTTVCMTVEYPWSYAAAQLHCYYDLCSKPYSKHLDSSLLEASSLPI